VFEWATVSRIENTHVDLNTKDWELAIRAKIGPTSDVNTNQPNHGPSRHHGDIGMSTELEHVRGTINNDEYAVINRNILQHQHHPPTTTVINRGAIKAKIGPTSDVDKIFPKMYSQYVLFRNKYSQLICASNSSQRIDKVR
jgi:hypothetical protein